MIVFLFDIDGTLVSTGGAGQAALDQAFADAFGMARQHEVPISGRTDRGIAREMFLKHGVEDSTEHWHRLRQNYLSHLPRQLLERPGRVLPGVCELLAHLAARPDISMGLLTGNVHEGARLKLTHFNMYHHFRFGGFGDESFDRDQVAEIALRDARRATPVSFSLENTWVVGDTPLDIRCARSIGARVCAVATGLHSSDELASSQPDLLLDSLIDLDSFLSATIEKANSVDCPTGH